MQCEGRGGGRAGGATGAMGDGRQASKQRNSNGNGNGNDNDNSSGSGSGGERCQVLTTPPRGDRLRLQQVRDGDEDEEQQQQYGTAQRHDTAGVRVEWRRQQRPGQSKTNATWSEEQQRPRAYYGFSVPFCPVLF